MAYCRRCGRKQQSNNYGCKQCKEEEQWNNHCGTCGKNIHTIMFPTCGTCYKQNNNSF